MARRSTKSSAGDGCGCSLLGGFVVALPLALIGVPSDIAIYYVGLPISVLLLLLFFLMDAFKKS